LAQSAIDNNQSDQGNPVLQLILDDLIMPCEELMLADVHRKFYFLNALDIVNIREDNKELVTPLYELDKGEDGGQSL
jgi:hypothetical protein